MSTTLDLAEVRARLTELIGRAANGEEIVICEAGQPLVKIVAIEDAAWVPRPRIPRVLGGWEGLVVPDDFDDPLPDDLLDAFYGASED